MQSEFVPIDQTKWPRAQMFYYFSQMAPTGSLNNMPREIPALLSKSSVSFSLKAL